MGNFFEKKLKKSHGSRHNNFFPRNFPRKKNEKSHAELQNNFSQGNFTRENEKIEL